MLSLWPTCARRDGRARPPGTLRATRDTSHLAGRVPVPGWTEGFWGSAWSSHPPGALSGAHIPGSWASKGNSPGCCVHSGLRAPAWGLPPTGGAHTVPAPPELSVGTPSQPRGGLPCVQHTCFQPQCTEAPAFQCLPASTGLPGATSGVPTTRLVSWGSEKPGRGELAPGGPCLRGIRHSAVTQGAVCCQHAFPRPRSRPRRRKAICL